MIARIDKKSRIHIILVEFIAGKDNHYSVIAQKTC